MQARAAAGLLVAVAALSAVVRSGTPVPGDAALHRPPADGVPRAVALIVDLLTGYAATAVVTGLVVLVLLWCGRPPTAVGVALSVTTTLVATTLLKQVVGRPRPELLPPTAAVSPLSFPSGHAAASAAVALALVLAVGEGRARTPAAVTAALLVLGAGAAQLVLARHHASDLVGGWLLAAGVTSAVWAALIGRGQRVPSS